MKLFIHPCLLIAVALSLLPAARAQEPDRFWPPTPVDSWVLLLSWSPQYCDANLGSKEPQCTEENYFVTHGLRPQFEDKSQKRCEDDAEFPPPLLMRALDVLPNRTLLRREWRRHGACTGLGMNEYVVQMDYAGRKVVIPEPYRERRETLETTRDQIKAEFVKSNPKLFEDAMRLHCSGRWLREVQFCFDTHFNYRDCGLEMRDRCKEQVRLRRVRPSLVDD